MSTYSNRIISEAAAQWAVGKVGCSYSQAKRYQENIFDCSSLVARAYTAMGKIWKYGGSMPTSMYEVYDDDFELLWPSAYADIGRSLGSNKDVGVAYQSGDLLFLCTGASSRHNRITHVAMVADERHIVHARGAYYGVCLNNINLYDGKLCAVARYNPEGALRKGMCGWRTLALQKTLNARGADLSEDGEFGTKTAMAVTRYRESVGMGSAPEADTAILRQLGLLAIDSTNEKSADNLVKVTGKKVNLRKGPGTEYAIAGSVSASDVLQTPDTSEWLPVKMGNAIYWISKEYIEGSVISDE